MYIHDIKLEETNRFSEQFNICSDLWNRYLETGDESILQQFKEERLKLELGQY